jgi:hypothetical protein
VQYAQWEEGQKDFRRARSVWERALDVSYTNPTTWLKYAEMEMRHRFINHARNVWDRAVSLLPRVDQLWCGLSCSLSLLTAALQDLALMWGQLALDAAADAARASAHWTCERIDMQGHGAECQPRWLAVLQVQVHPHGGDAGECAWGAPDL